MIDDRKLPPQSIESEMSILGAVFLDNACLRKVSGMMDVTDFYREPHRKILTAMLHHQKTGQPIDLITLTKTLKSLDALEEIGGAAYLATLVDYVPTSANVAYYCRTVKEMAVRRQTITFAQEVMTKAYDATEDFAEIIPEAKEGLADIAANMDSFGGVSLSDLSTFEQRRLNYERRIKTIDQDRFITEYELLDQIIRGVAPGEVLTIVAEPGGFKTAFLQNLLKRGCRRTNLSTLFFSMEMPSEKVFEREVQIDCEVSGWDVERHFKGVPTYGVRVEQPKSEMIVCEKPRLTLEKMERYADLSRQKFGTLAAVGVDFLQLMPGPGKIFDRIEHNAYGVKTLAKSLNLPFILLSQINVMGRKEKGGISFSDAKGGGAIEEAADIGLGFYHDKDGALVCEVLKNRNGPRGKKLEALLNRKAFKFLDFTEYVEPKKGKRTEEETECPI